MLKILHFLWYPRMNRNLLNSVLLQQYWSSFILIKFIHLKIKHCKSKNNFSLTKRKTATSHGTQEQSDFYSHKTRYCVAQLSDFFTLDFIWSLERFIPTAHHVLTEWLSFTFWECFGKNGWCSNSSFHKLLKCCPWGFRPVLTGMLATSC